MDAVGQEKTVYDGKDRKKVAGWQTINKRMIFKSMISTPTADD